MERGTLIITVPAQADLRNLWSRIAEHDLSAADRMLDLVLERAKVLAEFPYSGRERPELGPDYRSMAADPYVIFYRPRNDGVAILRVAHTAQDIDRIAEEGGFE